MQNNIKSKAFVTKATTPWEKNDKKRHVGGGSGSGSGVVNDCMHLKVTLPSFWPALLVNLGICALLLVYLFIGRWPRNIIKQITNYMLFEGSFLFMSIENVAVNTQYNDWNRDYQNQNQHARNQTFNEQAVLQQINVKSTQDYNGGRSDYVEIEERQRTVENIWEITVSLNILYKENWTRLAALELSRFQNHLMKRLALDLENNAHAQDASRSSLTTVKAYYRHQQSTSTHMRQVEWRFSTSFLYSLTLISTVGRT